MPSSTRGRVCGLLALPVSVCLATLTACGGDSQDPTPEPDPIAVTATNPFAGGDIDLMYVE